MKFIVSLIALLLVNTAALAHHYYNRGCHHYKIWHYRHPQYCGAAMIIAKHIDSPHLIKIESKSTITPINYIEQEQERIEAIKEIIKKQLLKRAFEEQDSNK